MWNLSIFQSTKILGAIIRLEAVDSIFEIAEQLNFLSLNFHKMSFLHHPKTDLSRRYEDPSFLSNQNSTLGES